MRQYNVLVERKGRQFQVKLLRVDEKEDIANAMAKQYPNLTLLEVLP